MFNVVPIKQEIKELKCELPKNESAWEEGETWTRIN